MNFLISKTLVSRTSVIGLLVLLSGQGVRAEPPMPPLAANNTPEQVAAAWGQPRDKIEKETLREERWLYERGEALFRDGRLVDWKVASRNLPSATPVASLKNGHGAPTAARPEDLSKVITELVDELPSEDGAPAPGGMPPAMPVGGPAQ